MFALIVSFTTLPHAAALTALQGEWRAVKVYEKGEAWNNKEEIAEVVLEIAGDMLIYKRNLDEIEKFRITLDPAQGPARIDLRLIAKGVDTKLACHAIYSLEKGQLHLGLPTEFRPNPADERPQVFTTGGNRPPQSRLLFVMERVKK